MAIRIDDSHQPYKRAHFMGPGPKKGPKKTEADKWECKKGKNTSKYYVQVCKYVGEDAGKKGAPKRGAKKTVKQAKGKKKAYNKKYRAWLKARAKRGLGDTQSRFGNKKPNSDYGCRKTAVAKCK